MILIVLLFGCAAAIAWILWTMWQGRNADFSEHED